MKAALNVKRLVIIGSVMICLIMLIIFFFSGVTRAEISKLDANGGVVWSYVESNQVNAIEIERAINSAEAQKAEKSGETAVYKVTITYNYVMKTSALFNVESEAHGGKMAVYGSENDFVLPDESQELIKEVIAKATSEEKA